MVLVHSRSSSVFSLGKWSPQLPAGFPVSRRTQDPDPHRLCFAYGAITRFGQPFQCCSTTRRCLLSVLQPRRNRSHAGLGCSAFARHYSRNPLFSSGYLDVSVPRVPRSMTMCSSWADLTLLRPGFPIRKSTDRRSSATPRRLSQRNTSFIGI